ncbi:class II fructose-bisphosphatase [Methanosarcinaceae archaeon]|nr:class II fructose-bisphosphatase [Methanosarcinaceae archaeon]MBQ3620688.1 class II fructose-bisphosphatase [Methanosarcinaceae archaeon]
MNFSDKAETLMNTAAGPIEKNVLPHLIHITEAAAVASAYEVGRGDRKYADHMATEAMRRMLNHIDIKGTIKIGEGERDEAPMLFIGEEVGTGNGPEVEIAVDPLEGTNLAADNINGSITVMCMAEKGGIFHGPDIYFDKIVVGPEVVRYEKETGRSVSIDASPLENLKIVAEALGKEISEVSVVVLERDRHKKLIKELREAGARVSLIPDGDLMPGVFTCIGNVNVDMVMGAGGSGEAVLTASAVKCLGGKVTGRLVLPSVANGKSEEDIRKELAEKLPRLEKMGIPENEISKIRNTEDLVPGKDVIFAATAVTEGPIMRAAKIFNDGNVRLTTLTIGASGCVRVTESYYAIDKTKKQIFL